MSSKLSSYERNFISLPKVEVHAHLGGSVRPATVKDLLLAGDDNKWKETNPPPSPLHPRHPVHGIPIEPNPFFGFQIVAEAHGNDPTKIRRIVREYITDCLNDGIRYIELRTGGEKSNLTKIILEELNHPNLLGAALIISLKRDRPVDSAHRVINNILEQLKSQGTASDSKVDNARIVAIDFCGVDTRSNPFTTDFSHAVKSSGLPFVPHFGELRGEQDLSDILDASPKRLGHAVFLPLEVEQIVFEKKIPIECCLVCNLNCMLRDKEVVVPELQLADSKDNVERIYQILIAQQHPFVKWFLRNHPFVLCCDNIGLIGFPLSEIYQIAAETLCCVEMFLEEERRSGREGCVSVSVTAEYCSAWVRCLRDSNDESERIRTRVGAIAWKMARSAVELTFADANTCKALVEELMDHPWSPQMAKV